MARFSRGFRPDLPPNFNQETTVQMISESRWSRLRVEILVRDAHICQYCGKPATTVDHVMPKGRGGSELPANLVSACSDCNTRKGWLKFASFEEAKTFLANPSNRCYPPPFSFDEREDDRYTTHEWKTIQKSRVAKKRKVALA